MGIGREIRKGRERERLGAEGLRASEAAEQGKKD